MSASPSASTPIRSPIICLKILDANTIGGRYSEADQVREIVVALKNINSHIQLPNLILKHFRDETDDTKKVWYLDISSGKIRQSAALKLGTSKGYYSGWGELFWNRAIENPLGELTHKICCFSDEKIADLKLTTADKRTAKRYIKAASIRSDIAYEAMKSSSVTADFFSDQENHDSLSVFGMSLTGNLNQILDAMDVTILLNQTDRNLVVPRNCYYGVSISGDGSIVAPLSPKVALFLFSAKSHPEWENGFAVVRLGEIIEEMNIYALKYEYMFNKAFVASNSYQELEQLQKFREDHLAELEMLNADI